MSDVVLVEGARTPHGTLLGALADVSAVELGRTALDGLLDRVSIDGTEVKWVAMGNAIQAGIGQVPGRQAIIKSDLANSTPVTTVNEASGTSIRTIALAADRITAGRANFVIAGGFESMTNAPWVLPDYRKGQRYGDVTIKDSMILDSLWDINLDVHMGEIAERLVDRVSDQYDLSREAQDQYALESHRCAADSIKSGRFQPEIISVETPAELVEHDEGPRPESTMEDLGRLNPSFRENGTVTPANASKLSDGAGAMLLADREAAEDAGLTPILELVDYEVIYRTPDEFNEAVGDVVEVLLKQNDLAIKDIDYFQINEAFAVQMVYLMERLGIPREKLNPDGGAIAFGHPIGGSGAMIATSLAYAMQADDLTYGVAGMSIGGGGAIMSLWRR